MSILLGRAFCSVLPCSASARNNLQRGPGTIQALARGAPDAFIPFPRLRHQRAPCCPPRHHHCCNTSSRSRPSQISTHPRQLLSNSRLCLGAVPAVQRQRWWLSCATAALAGPTFVGGDSGRTVGLRNVIVPVDRVSPRTTRTHIPPINRPPLPPSPTDIIRPCTRAI
ncbi:hypothetical protein BDW22DRAFT_1191346 [Trametopsis cervina]|nr:hypothetical protein BDW22DRAFT_1191346 [Trametopsis cervina]